MKIILCFFACGALIVANALGAVPLPLANEVKRAKGMFNETSTKAYRVQLMVIAPGVFIDPPLEAADFKSAADVIVTIESGTCFDLIHETLDAMEASKWERQQLQGYGYPRAYWRLVGPWDYIVFDLLVDAESSAVCNRGIWYRVDRKLIEKLTRDFTELALRNLPRAKASDSKSPPATQPKGEVERKP